MQILLVDDNELQASTREAILSRGVASVRVARTASEALAIMGDPAGRQSIGLLVTDHLMPEMNGPELVRRVREILPELPILVLSGMPDAEAQYVSLQVIFRLKPFPPPDLIRLTKHMLGSRALRSA